MNITINRKSISCIQIKKEKNKNENSIHSKPHKKISEP